MDHCLSCRVFVGFIPAIYRIVVMCDWGQLNPICEGWDKNCCHQMHSVALQYITIDLGAVGELNSSSLDHIAGQEGTSCPSPRTKLSWKCVELFPILLWLVIDTLPLLFDYSDRDILQELVWGATSTVQIYMNWESNNTKMETEIDDVTINKGILQ